MELENIIAVARGSRPADLVLKNACVVNVFTDEVYPADVAIVAGRIAALGEDYVGREQIDLTGKFLCPGFIDAHVHIESAMVPPSEFARAVLPHGVTTVVADPHEIANVLGMAGIRFMLADSSRSLLQVFFTLPSCVPATDMETSGARLEASDLEFLRDDPNVLGLGEVMNYPGVVAAEKGILDKIRAFQGKIVEGHCPGTGGEALNAYVAAGVMSDHECIDPAEALEKLRLGMTIFIRQATNARNLKALLPAVTESNKNRLCFCTDDRQPEELLSSGSIDDILRQAVSSGLDPLTAIRMATLHPSQYFHLHDRGAIAPGRRADLVVLNSLNNFGVEQVFVGGKLAATGGKMPEAAQKEGTAVVENSVHVDVDRLDFTLPAAGSRVRVIELVPEQLVTRQKIETCPRENGLATASVERDLLKIAVVERHHKSGRVGLGFVRGLGFHRGAIATSVAHDHHNIVAAGADDPSLATAVRAVAAAGGGMAAALGRDVLAMLPLPIAGLMSDLPVEEASARHRQVLSAARTLGTDLRDPFMALSFAALPVIPELKITDRGLVDVLNFQLTELFLP